MKLSVGRKEAVERGIFPSISVEAYNSGPLQCLLGILVLWASVAIRECAERRRMSGKERRGRTASEEAAGGERLLLRPRCKPCSSSESISVSADLSSASLTPPLQFNAQMSIIIIMFCTSPTRCYAPKRNFKQSKNAGQRRAGTRRNRE